ncbi:MAG: RHS repeat-associated core domain-containing protein, partial [Nitrospira sp.]|nr:RHS repeat-associated core domain-containing protein [Nitrospira sp.]
TVTNSCGTTTYTWDARNSLVGINGYKSDCTALTASFKYDALGRRIEKTVNGVTTQYVYDGMDIIQEKQNGSVSANYIRTLNIDEPLARVKGSVIRHYKTDALGSVVRLLDDLGYVKTIYTYDPFGNVTVSGEPSDNPFQYTGRENDGTGLYYYRVRYYSPELQRFISEDPLSLSQVLLLGQNPSNLVFANQIYKFALRNSQVLNKYLYTTNNPLIYTDPYGLINWGKVGGGLAMMGGGLVITGGGVFFVLSGFAEMSVPWAAGPVAGALGVAMGSHTVGVGGSMIALGGFTIYTGWGLVKKGI